MHVQRRHVMRSAAALGAATALPALAQAQSAQRAICYNCPPEWADWGGMLGLINQKLGIAVPPDNKNSGQSLAALIAERANPVADVVYLGGQVGPAAREAGVITAHRPQRFDQIPAGLKDPEGFWFTIHSGTLGFFVNTAALRGKPVPRGWKDLLKPDYRGLVGYLNPASAAVGQVGVITANLALGGSYENLDAGIGFFKQLQANQPIVPTQTAYARVLSGEIPILLDPYVMALVARGPNPEQGRRMLDFVLSDEGQRHWANAYLRPVFPAAMSAEVKSRFLPDAEYARARPLDVFKLAAAAKVIGERYAKEVS